MRSVQVLVVALVGLAIAGPTSRSSSPRGGEPSTGPWPVGQLRLADMGMGPLGPQLGDSSDDMIVDSPGKLPPEPSMVLDDPGRLPPEPDMVLDDPGRLPAEPDMVLDDPGRLPPEPDMQIDPSQDLGAQDDISP